MSYNKKILIFSVIYLIIFIILPFTLLNYTMIIKDFGYYLFYYLFLNPIIFIIYLMVVKFKLKANLRPFLLLIFIILLLNVPIYIYLYKGIAEALGHIYGGI